MFNLNMDIFVFIRFNLVIRTTLILSKTVVLGMLWELGNYSLDPMT